LILLQNIVPISLYVTMEIIKTMQAYFIWRDQEMYYEPIDVPCTPKTWTIADDLGTLSICLSVISPDSF
jgi:phospholipid-translocating ATPase